MENEVQQIVKMQLFTLKKFRGRFACVHHGWRLSSDGTMVVEGPDGREHCFNRITIGERSDIGSRVVVGEEYCEYNIGSHLVLDGIVQSDGQWGKLLKDNFKLKNKGQALLCIVSESNIHLPEHLFHDNRVKIVPIANKSGSLVATIICFLKCEELKIVFGDGTRQKAIWFAYDSHSRFPNIMNVALPAKRKGWCRLLTSWLKKSAESAGVVSPEDRKPH